MPEHNSLKRPNLTLGDGNKMWIIYITMEFQSTGGLLCTSERKEQVSALDLRVILFVLKSLVKGLAKVHIKVLTEN